MFCRSCGEPIKKEAEICPHCGVRNNDVKASQSTNSTTTTTHDPSQFDTTVSENWWYGVAAGTVLWTLFIILSGSLPDAGAVVGLILLITWVGMPLSAYFDMQYVRANSKWNPNSVLWVILMVIWFVNIVAGAVYLYRRHEVLDVP